MGLLSFFFGKHKHDESSESPKPPSPPSKPPSPPPPPPFIDISKGITQEQLKTYLSEPPADRYWAVVEAQTLAGQLKNLIREKSIFENGLDCYTRSNPYFRGEGIASFSVRGTPAEQKKLNKMDDLQILILKRLEIILNAHRIVEEELPSEYEKCPSCGAMVPWFVAIGNCPRCRRQIHSPWEIDKDALERRKKWRVYPDSFWKWC